jgi:MYXO-CTERM domain-containing protein
MVVFALLGADTARAFCGFYVSGADASLYNDATMVVMMREDNRTVLSMQNNYQGPPEDFALVVPVPEVLQKKNVKTLPDKVFDRVDKLASPRLVEYWEKDPCKPEPRMMEMAAGATGGAQPRAARQRSAKKHGVKIEAEFKVGEYDIVILSASDSAGLDTWLRENDYNIPEGAEPVLRPYVEQGTKFFVAKVDTERVEFEDGRAVLSPLRFHYDSDEFSLPVRLGTLNSAGNQDLIVHILARGQRYEVANYPNATIPTNIRVKDAVRQEFGSWYDMLFRRTVASNEGAVVTEYAWNASSCDPCPTRPLTAAELKTLGTDVIAGGSSDSPGTRGRRLPGPRRGGGFVLTRLHHRYGKDGLDEDLVFKAAPPITGGRGMPNEDGELPDGEQRRSGMNNFQGRYVILNRWEGEIDCENPNRGRWGGPPGGEKPDPVAAGGGLRLGPQAEDGLEAIGPAVAQDIPAIQVQAGKSESRLAGDPGPLGGASAGGKGKSAEDPKGESDEDSKEGKTEGTTGAAPEPSDSGCASCRATGTPAGAVGGVLPMIVALALTARRRRRATRSARRTKDV